MAETIYRENVLDRYVSDMQRYAISLCRKQAVPDVKDGFKSVGRRVMMGFIDEKLYPNKPYSKSAGVVGTVMKKYHPHGDSSIYGVMVLMARWWDCKMPYIDGHGGWGTMQGDPESAQRYTECRLTEYACDCIIGDLDTNKQIVDWVPNYNEQYLEPEYMPAMIPNLLINGTLGIAIGMKVEIPTHNLSEVVDATINVLKNPAAPVVLIPDHNQPVDIIDTNWKQICNTGFGTYRARGHVDIEYDKKDHPLVIIKSFPNAVTLMDPAKDEAGVIGSIKTMIKEGKLPFVEDLNDETSEKRDRYDQLRYVIKLKKGSDPNYFKSLLYKKTLLENTYRVNFEALDGIELNRYSYKAYIEKWIDFAMTLKFRTYAAKYQQAISEFTKLQLYIKLMESGDIDIVKDKIAHCKKVDAEGKKELIEWIIKKFKVTDGEAKFILEMDFFKTAPGFLPIYKERSKVLEQEYTEYFIKMNDDSILKQEIIDQLLVFKKKYGKPRLCKVIKDTKDEVPAGTFKVVVTENNYIRKIQENDKVVAVKGDNPKFILKVDNRESILLFDRVGKVFKLPISKIPVHAYNFPGTDLRLMIKGCTADIVTMMYEPSVIEMSKSLHKQHLVIVTEGNSIKRMELDDFINVPPSGILYTKLSQNDFVKDLTIIPEGFDIVLYNQHKALRFNVNDVPLYKRTAIGVIGMGGEGNNTIDGLSVIANEPEYMLVITRSGKVNKIPTAALPRKERNKAGSNVIKLGKTDTIFAIIPANNSFTLHLNTSKEALTIPVSDIKDGSSLSAGVKVTSDVIVKANVMFN